VSNYLPFKRKGNPYYRMGLTYLRRLKRFPYKIRDEHSMPGRTFYLVNKKQPERQSHLASGLYLYRPGQQKTFIVFAARVKKGMEQPLRVFGLRIVIPAVTRRIESGKPSCVHESMMTTLIERLT
jgi:hypothetical protein